MVGYPSYSLLMTLPTESHEPLCKAFSSKVIQVSAERLNATGNLELGH